MVYNQIVTWTAFAILAMFLKICDVIESGKVENVKMWTVVVVAVPWKGSEGSPILNVVSILKRMLPA